MSSKSNRESGIVESPSQGTGGEPKTINVGDLIPDSANLRVRTDRNREVLANSLKQFGAARSILVDSDGVVRAGNGTLEAAIAAGIDTAKVIETDGSELIVVKRTDMTGSDATAYAIADNRSAELATWDLENLDKQLASLSAMDYDLEDLGFAGLELSDMLEAGGVDSSGSGDDEELEETPAQLDRADELRGEWGTEAGQLWEIAGKQTHRLLCGDCCDPENVERLMGDVIASLVETDPPYGVSYQSNMRTKSAKFEELANDDVMLTDWIAPALATSKGFVIVWTSWKVLAEWMQIVRDHVGDITNVAIWNKGGGGMGDLEGSFSTDYEVAIVCNRGAKLTGKRIGSVWSVGKDAASDYRHPTQKPVEIMGVPMRSVTKEADTVYDPFLGSGTTMLAAEQLNRRCFGMEISPKYCAVILQRMHDAGLDCSKVEA